MSIYNNIRSSKVTTGNAAQYQNMRTFDSSAQVCPVRANVSDSGTPGVARDSINTYTAGCFSPLDRMTVENVLRPSYSTYLNAQSIALGGVGDDNMTIPNDEYQNKPSGTDTMFGNMYIRQVGPEDALHPVYKASNFKFATSEAMKNPQYQESDYIQCITNRKYDNRYCQGGAFPFNS